MPSAIYLDTIDNDDDIPGQILGRDRTTKTWLEDLEGSTLLSKIGRHTVMLSELFRRLHARSHTIDVLEKDPETGEPKKIDTKPEVLTDNEIMERYPVVKEWFKGHRHVVDHNVSVQGFSVTAASGKPTDTTKSSKTRSSASDETDDSVAW